MSGKALKNMTILSRSTELVKGFFIKRILPFHQKRSVGPFVFVDHFGPTKKRMNVGVHPHVNLCTLTFLLKGNSKNPNLMHRDSTGAQQLIRPGDVNFMVAGKGILHSERNYPIQSTRIQSNENENENDDLEDEYEGLQIWIALPKEFEEVNPSFHHVDSEKIPTLSIDSLIKNNQNGGFDKQLLHVKVLLGNVLNPANNKIITCPFPTYNPNMYLLNISLIKNQTFNWTIPPNYEIAFMPIDGDISIQTETLSQSSSSPSPSSSSSSSSLLVTNGNMSIFENESSSSSGSISVSVRSESDSVQLIIFAGVPFVERRFMFWNFVSSDPSRIEKALNDYNNLLFPPIPFADETDYIPAPPVSALKNMKR